MDGDFVVRVPWGPLGAPESVMSLAGSGPLNWRQSSSPCSAIHVPSFPLPSYLCNLCVWGFSQCDRRPPVAHTLRGLFKIDSQAPPSLAGGRTKESEFLTSTAVITMFLMASACLPCNLRILTFPELTTCYRPHSHPWDRNVIGSIFWEAW